MFFQPEAPSAYRTDRLSTFHFPAHMLPKVKEIYLDRVDPLIKVLHLPTFFVSLAKALQQPEDVPKSLEAAIFAFYYATVSSLREDECQSLFYSSKEDLCTRYRYATRRALVNAGFLSTTSPMTLRAYVIFIVS